MTNALSGEQKHRKLDRLLEFSGGDFCFYCGSELLVEPSKRQAHRLRTYDHIVPLSEGGTNHLWNLVLSCRRCNHRKGSETLEWFLTESLRLKPKAVEAKFEALELRRMKLKGKAKKALVSGKASALGRRHLSSVEEGAETRPAVLSP